MTEIIVIAMKGASKTQIMYKANLSFSQLKRYLALLLRHNLLEKSVSNGRATFKATARGLAFMERQKQIIDFLDEDSNRTNVG